MMDFIERSNQCTKIEQLVHVFEESISELGFNKFVYSLMRGSFSKLGETQHGVAQSYPEDWMAYYLEKNYVNHDPTYRRALRDKGIFTWKQLQTQVPLSKTEKVVMNEAKEAGLHSGVSLSIHGPYGEVMGFGFASDDPNLDTNKNQLSLLHAMANQFHLVYSEIGHNFKEPTIMLSDRQKEILQWAAVGKSRSIIAVIIGISEETINDHFKEIFRKLQCGDRTVAVLKAIQLGLIKI